MKRIIIITLTMLLLSGCAVQKNWGSSGGSKSDGIVKLSYTYGAMQIPTTDPAQGLAKAQQICERWGYVNAEPFDFSNRVCNSYYNGSCNGYMVTKEYQCL